MSIQHFLQSIPDKLNNFFFPHHVLQNILVLKTAVILISLSLFISSLALLILVISHHRSKKLPRQIKPDSSPTALPK